MDWENGILSARKEAESIHNIHKSKPVLLLGNGPSLDALDSTDDLACAAISMNRSWRKGPSEAQVFMKCRDYLDEIIMGDYVPKLILSRVQRSHGGQSFYGEKNYLRQRFNDARIEMPPTVSIDDNNRDQQFQLDLTLGTAAPITGIFALEIAAWMGHNPIFLLGYDCSDDGHFKYVAKEGSVFRNDLTMKRSSLTRFFEQAAPALERAKVEVLNLNSESRIRCFAFAPLEDLL